MKIAICALQAPVYTGGLGSYQRLLARSLRDEAETEVLFVSGQIGEDRSFESEAQTCADHLCILDKTPSGNAIDSILSRLASRPLLHQIMEYFCSLRWGRQLLSNPLLQNCDVIHFVGTGWDFFGFALASFAHNQGALFTIWPAVHQNSWGDDDIDLRLYNLADRVFCQSKFEAQHLTEKGLNPNKAVVAGLPPMCREDGDGNRLRKKLNLSDRPAVLFLGRRDSGKGYPAVLKAWKGVIGVVPEAVLLIAGPGGKEFESLKAQLPDSSFRDLGIPDELQKADAYAACDVFCLPSAHESFGIVYVEAWSYAKPVICGTAPASRELVQHCVTGLHADQSEHVLIPALISLLVNLKGSGSMGKAGRINQRERYSVAAMRDAHLNVFSDRDR